MARTIQFSISGSGMVYRECVRRKGIGYREYDRLFSRVVPDDPHAAARIAADRLLEPYDLAPVHEQAYEDYLRAHVREVLLQFVRDLAERREGPAAEENIRRLRLVADRGMITGPAADDALREAAESGLPEIAGILLSGRRISGQNTPEEADGDLLSLDDW